MKPAEQVETLVPQLSAPANWADMGEPLDKTAYCTDV
jgi:hypothetical protein